MLRNPDENPNAQTLISTLTLVVVPYGVFSTQDPKFCIPNSNPKQNVGLRLKLAPVFYLPRFYDFMVLSCSLPSNSTDTKASQIINSLRKTKLLQLNHILNSFAPPSLHSHDHAPSNNFAPPELPHRRFRLPHDDPPRAQYRIRNVMLSATVSPKEPVFTCIHFRLTARRTTVPGTHRSVNRTK